MKRKTRGLIAAVLAIAAIAVAGCGGGDSGGSASGPGDGAYGGGGTNRPGGEEKPASAGGGAEGGAESGSAVVSLRSVRPLGMVLVDANGMTLYDFHKDKGGQSSCYGACTAIWPPLLSKGKAQVGNGASASMIGTVERKDGTTQVTYAGHPLYTYAGDKKPGEANGNDIDDFGSEWYALQGNGEEPED